MSTGIAPDKALDRIHKLLALAASPQEEEARTAAALAAKMIRAFGVTLSIGGAHTGGARVGDETPSTLMKPRIITSQYSGLCRTCGNGYAAGDRIQWLRGKGAAHTTCAWVL